MNVLYAKAAVIAAAVAMVAIRAPHGNRSLRVPVAESRKGVLEKALLTLAWVSFFLPFAWCLSPVLAFADVPLHPAALAAGVAVNALGLWVFHRSHADLGTNWSISLEVREGHTLVTGGVYSRVRHPMYLGLLLYSVGQALFLPNLVAGPAYLAVMALIVGCRLGPEERMMRDRFGAAWDDYAAGTRRLVPGVW
jgi:protein-S-isoprenylcysteine O-methyltransferase Ste14